MRNIMTALLIALLFQNQALAVTFSNDQPLDAEVVFNQPGLRGAATTTIEQKLVTVIGHAIPGSKIRMAMFSFSRPAIAAALAQASRRDVDVRVVLDGSDEAGVDENNSAVQLLKGLRCSEERAILQSL